MEDMAKTFWCVFNGSQCIYETASHSTDIKTIYHKNEITLKRVFMKINYKR